MSLQRIVERVIKKMTKRSTSNLTNGPSRDANTVRARRLHPTLDASLHRCVVASLRRRHDRPSCAHACTSCQVDLSAIGLAPETVAALQAEDCIAQHGIAEHTGGSGTHTWHDHAVLGAAGGGGARPPGHLIILHYHPLLQAEEARVARTMSELPQA